MKKSARPPVIIIGMHRSGTTMITRMLKELGLFIGENLEPNDEDWLFIGLNDWLLRHSGGAWDQPEPIETLINQPEVRTMVTEYLHCHLRSWRVARFVGVQKYLQGEGPMTMSVPWGWKDPRNTFTLPLWLELFPEAKLIHIYRHGVDVATSLHVREKQSLLRHRRKHRRRMLLRLYYLFRKTGGSVNRGFVNSPRCLDPLGGFQLWESYVSKASEHTNSLPNGSMTIKYEDFLKNPSEQLAELAAFCELETDEKDLIEVSKGVRANRGRAFEHNEELRSFFEQVKDSPLLQRLGYRS